MKIPVQKSCVPKVGHMEAVARPRVLLADDQESVLARTAAILCDFDLVGVVHNGRDAIAECSVLTQMC